MTSYIEITFGKAFDGFERVSRPDGTAILRVPFSDFISALDAQRDIKIKVTTEPTVIQGEVLPS